MELTPYEADEQRTSLAPKQLGGTTFFNVLSSIKHELVNSTQVSNDMKNLKDELYDKDAQIEVLKGQLKVLQDHIPIEQAQIIEDESRKHRYTILRQQELDKLRAAYKKVRLQLQCFLSKEQDILDNAAEYGFTRNDLESK